MNHYIPSSPLQTIHLGESYDAITESLTSLDTYLGILSSNIIDLNTDISSAINVISAAIVTTQTDISEMATLTANISYLDSIVDTLSSDILNWNSVYTTTDIVTGFPIANIELYNTPGLTMAVNPTPGVPRPTFIRMVGGGGGGGGGYGGNTAGGGGGGGSGASVVEFWTDSTILDGRYIEVGAGGVGGLAANPGVAGGDGAHGGISCVVGLMTALGGRGGGGGSSGAFGGYNFTSYVTDNSIANGWESFTPNLGGYGYADLPFIGLYETLYVNMSGDDCGFGWFPTGGGTGGGNPFDINSGSSVGASLNGGSGGRQGDGVNIPYISGGSGGISGSSPTNVGGDGVYARGVGTGGGGGGTGGYGHGGDGGGYGAGGGGGGKGVGVGISSGHGGDGSSGYVLVITY